MLIQEFFHIVKKNKKKNCEKTKIFSLCSYTYFLSIELSADLFLDTERLLFDEWDIFFQSCN